MKKSWYWSQEHNDVVQKILRKARKKTRIIYIPGNHDENFRDFAKHRFGRVSVLNETIHFMADGRKFLVLHGDQFDGIVKYAKWLAYLGDRAYNTAIIINIWVNIIRRKLGFSYWSLSSFLKHKVKNAVEYISNYEKAIVSEAKKKNVNGVICGHIHTAEIREIDGILYCNDGDWVESCTALVEHLDGRLEILNWAEMPHIVGAEKTETEQWTSSLSQTPGFPKSTASSGH
jgi:UDP-2,3-diacylglucosamine pyrophosphatase LpxH